MNKLIAVMLVAAFAVVAGCAKAPAEEVEVMVETGTAVEVVMPTVEETVVEEVVAPTEEAPAADAAMEVEVY